MTTLSLTLSSSTTSTSLVSSATGIPLRDAGKRGLCYSNVNYTQYFSLSGQNSQVNWAYNYAALPNATNNKGQFNPALTFVPLLYNSANGATSVFAAGVNFSIANYYTDSILAFNEPDACGGGSSCMLNASATAQAYYQYMQPFAGRVHLGAPAVTNGDPPAGLTYLSYFLGNCTLLNCTIDFIPIHWYASPYNFAYLQSYVEQAYEVGGGRPIWVTEFGMDQTYNDADVLAFMMNATTFFDQTAYVERVAWFGDFAGLLLNANGTGLSADGVVFNNYTGGYVGPPP